MGLSKSCHINSKTAKLSVTVLYLCFLFSKSLFSDGIIKSSYLMKCCNNTQPLYINQNMLFLMTFSWVKLLIPFTFIKPGMSIQCWYLEKMGRRHGFFPEGNEHYLCIQWIVSKYQNFCLSCICPSRYRTRTSCNRVWGFLGCWFPPPSSFWTVYLFNWEYTRNGTYQHTAVLMSFLSASCL